MHNILSSSVFQRLLRLCTQSPSEPSFSLACSSSSSTTLRGLGNTGHTIRFCIQRPCLSIVLDLLKLRPLISTRCPRMQQLGWGMCKSRQSITLDLFLSLSKALVAVSSFKSPNSIGPKVNGLGASLERALAKSIGSLRLRSPSSLYVVNLWSCLLSSSACASSCFLPPFLAAFAFLAAAAANRAFFSSAARATASFASLILIF